MTRLLLFFVLAGICSKQLIAQSNFKNDSLLQSLIEKRAATQDKGVTLIQSGEFKNANTFYSASITEDQSNSHAYFNRAVTSWAMSDTLNACRDWSAVLALGDTEMFNLLDSRCHGSMIIANDTIPSSQYHSLFSKNNSIAVKGKQVVTEMPEYPGGSQELMQFLSTHIRKPKEGKHGLVYVQFLISPKGKIIYPYVTRGMGGAYDKEALRLIRSMPDWKPGRMKGKATYVNSSVPVRF